MSIPLFRSARFIDTIIANIEAINMPDVEVLISDRHCLDNTIDRLAKHYTDDPRVRCIRQKDELDWVGNLNALLQEAQGEYWRFLPHDDISPPGSLEALVSALETNADAILAYGPTRAIDGEGRPLPERDKPSPHPEEAQEGWTFGLVLQMFWKGYFYGALKGLIRRKTVMDKNLLIRSITNQILPERCWQFALCLLGRYVFVPEATYVKRFYEGSVHSHWKITGLNFLSAAHVMSSYLYDLLDHEAAYCYGTRDLWLNARSRAKWQDKPAGERPRYQAAPDAHIDILRNLQLPLDGELAPLGK
ncbi:glycosyltransferase family 2 protein [bacterium]|nr:glycosyltransferase family 2 protein [bacterium]